MSEYKKPAYRKRHLFARSLDEVVKNATKPLMDKQGKLYGALLADWPQIVGEERARICRPAKLQFPAKEATGATLHLNVHPAHTPSLQYELETILEQCARYFGYRAIIRIVLHQAHEMVAPEPAPPPATAPADGKDPQDMRELLHRMRQRIMSGETTQ
jgi:hypothetical protein